MPQDSGLDFSSRYKIWQAPRQCYRDGCQISERYKINIHPISRFRTSRDLAIGRPLAKWIKEQIRSKDQWPLLMKRLIRNWLNRHRNPMVAKLIPGKRPGPPPFTNMVVTLIPAWIRNYIHHIVWDEITYPFPTFKGCTVEVWQWMSNFIPHFIIDMITYPCWY